MQVLPEYVSADGTLLGWGEEQLEQWDHRLFPTILTHLILEASIKQLQENSPICLLRALLSESWNWLNATIAMVTNGFTKKGLEITSPMTQLPRICLPESRKQIFEVVLQIASSSLRHFMLEFHQHSCGSVALNLKWMSCHPCWCGS